MQILAAPFPACSDEAKVLPEPLSEVLKLQVWVPAVGEDFRLITPCLT